MQPLPIAFRGHWREVKSECISCSYGQFVADRIPAVSDVPDRSADLYIWQLRLARTARTCGRDKEYPRIIPLQQFVEEMAPIVVDYRIQTNALRQRFGFTVCRGELLNPVFNCLHDMTRDDEPPAHNTNLDTAPRNPDVNSTRSQGSSCADLGLRRKTYTTLSLFMGPSPRPPPPISWYPLPLRVERRLRSPATEQRPRGFAA